MARFFKLRETPALTVRFTSAMLCIFLVLMAWTICTAGPIDSRWLSPHIIPSPSETFSSLGRLWFDQALMRNIIASLWRVSLGFGLAAVVGVPLGVVCGTWPITNAFLAPISTFGRNVPMSALVPLTLLWFGIDELQKVMFIFIACVMFVVFDSARAIASVQERYVQSAFTLGASTKQVLFKVLVPLAMPEIFTSLRLLFGIAFGYIILAEMVHETDGLGMLIQSAQRRALHEIVYLVLFTITLLAFTIDRALFFLELTLFPYREV